MSMTQREQAAKQEIIKILNKGGYPTYASLLSQYFDIHLTKDPKVVGYMVPEQGIITINEGLDEDCVSVVIRHEMMHEWLTHSARLQQKLGRDPDAGEHRLANIAGDYEISNRAYTDKDKRTSRRIKLNDQILRGLVTEDDHPDWINLSFEEMYEKLQKEYGGQMSKLQQSIQIGDMGDAEIQQAEEIARQAEIAAEQAQQGDSGSGSEDAAGEDSDQAGSGGQPGKKRSKSKKSKDLADEAEKVADEAEKLAKDIEHSEGGSDKVFQSKEEKKEDAQLQARLEGIKKAFADVKLQQQATAEAEIKVAKDKVAQADKEARRYQNSNLKRFENSMNVFLRRSLGAGKGHTWARLNRTHQGTGIMRKGTSRHVENKVPEINVYFDQSYSWSEEDLQIGRDAVGTLNAYVQRGQIKINLFYFSNHVHGSAKAARAEGGTCGQPILEHIMVTNPDNVIVMTDGDIGDCSNHIKVPGAVWLLFRDGIRSQNLINHLEGEQTTEIFDLESGGM